MTSQDTELSTIQGDVSVPERHGRIEGRVITTQLGAYYMASIRGQAEFHLTTREARNIKSLALFVTLIYATCTCGFWNEASVVNQSLSTTSCYSNL